MGLNRKVAYQLSPKWQILDSSKLKDLADKFPFDETAESSPNE